MGWRWVCEDEEESLGLRMLLERSGVVVTATEDDVGAVVLETSDEYEQRAAELQQRLLGSYARRIAVERTRALDRRDVWGTRTLVLGALVVSVIVVLAL